MNKHISAKNKVILYAGMMSLFSAAAPCYSAAIILNNPSFESPTVSNGSFNGDADGWGESGNAPARGIHNPDSSSYAVPPGDPLPGTALGFQVAFVGDSTALLSQSVGALVPNTAYTLTVAFGDSLTAQPAGWIQLLNSETGAILAENRNFSGVDGTFVDRATSFTSGPAVSGDLIVVLRSHSGTAHYDNIRLDTTPVPEPASFLTLLSGMTVLALSRKRDAAA